MGKNRTDIIKCLKERCLKPGSVKWETEWTGGGKRWNQLINPSFLPLLPVLRVDTSLYGLAPTVFPGDLSMWMRRNLWLVIPLLYLDPLLLCAFIIVFWECQRSDSVLQPVRPCRQPFMLGQRENSAQAQPCRPALAKELRGKLQKSF